jgi:hypothetical protein
MIILTATVVRSALRRASTCFPIGSRLRCMCLHPYSRTGNVAGEYLWLFRRSEPGSSSPCFCLPTEQLPAGAHFAYELFSRTIQKSLSVAIKHDEESANNAQIFQSLA